MSRDREDHCLRVCHGFVCYSSTFPLFNFFFFLIADVGRGRPGPSMKAGALCLLCRTLGVRAVLLPRSSFMDVNRMQLGLHLALARTVGS